MGTRRLIRETPRSDEPVLIFRGVGRAKHVIATLKLYIEGMGNRTLGEIYHGQAGVR